MFNKFWFKVKESIFNKFSLKTKILIFVVAAVVGIISIAYNTFGNWNSPIAKQSSLIKSETKDVLGEDNQKEADATAKAEAEKKQAETEAKAEDDKKQAEDDRIKALEDQWQTGYTEYNKDKNYVQCIKIMEDIISKDDKFYKAYTLKGIAECYSSSVYYDDGMKNLNKALEIKPDYGYGRFNKALALELYAKYPEAIEAYKSALQAEDYIWSYYGISSIYGRYGDAKNCVLYLNSAIKMDPDLIKSLVKNEHDFDNVRGSSEFIEATK